MEFPILLLKNVNVNYLLLQFLLSVYGYRISLNAPLVLILQHMVIQTTIIVETMVRIVMVETMVRIVMEETTKERIIPELPINLEVETMVRIVMEETTKERIIPELPINLEVETKERIVLIIPKAV